MCRFDSKVCQSDVDEALRLMRASKASLSDKSEGGGVRREDTVSLCHRWDESEGLEIFRIWEIPGDNAIGGARGAGTCYGGQEDCLAGVGCTLPVGWGWAAAVGGEKQVLTCSQHYFIPDLRLICEEAKRVMIRHPALERVELPFATLQRIIAKYNVSVGDAWQMHRQAH